MLSSVVKSKRRITVTKAALRQLVAKLRRIENQYRLAMVENSSQPIDRARYEGITIGSRWAAEDLEKLLS